MAAAVPTVEACPIVKVPEPPVIRKPSSPVIDKERTEAEAPLRVTRRATSEGLMITS